MKKFDELVVGDIIYSSTNYEDVVENTISKIERIDTAEGVPICLKFFFEGGKIEFVCIPDYEVENCSFKEFTCCIVVQYTTLYSTCKETVTDWIDSKRIPKKNNKI